ncbi:MAG: DUF4115 domain-containing protein [Actinobacteria bacterium]|nr:DUF4115 domain-containing protein [Actinomycetota bacterium]
MKLGERLKEARHKKGLSLKEVQTELRIRSSYLEAMENNNFDVIPGEAYRRAFLRTYAEFLGLDANELLREYETIYGKPEHYEGPAKEFKFSSTIFRIIAILIGAGIVFAAIKLALPEQKPKPELPQAPVDITKETTVTRETTETTSKTPSTGKGVKKSEVFSFKIEVTEDKCWIDIREKTTGKSLISKTLNQGQYFETTSSTTLTAIIGFPKGVAIFHNEREVTAIPRQGVVKLYIDSEGVSFK